MKSQKMYKLSIISKRKQVVIYLLGLKATCVLTGYKTTRHLSNSAPTERANSALVKFGTCQIRHLNFAYSAPRICKLGT